MSTLPDRPFLTAWFGHKSGGIDFLGMRQVNLSVFLERLLPGLNNVTGDLGSFCLGAWIPWKFRQLAGPKTYSSGRYERFQEAVEVAVALATRDGSPAGREFGELFNRIGARSHIRLPRVLSFAACTPERNATLFAAQQYGPSLKSLGFLMRESAPAVGGGPSGIPVAATDPDTTAIVSAVEAALAGSPHFDTIARLDPIKVDAPALDDLGRRGLHPGFHRTLPAAVKRAFLRKLFSADEAGEARRQTAALILATVAGTDIRSEEHLRQCWYTGLLSTGKALAVSDPDLEAHRRRWAVFHARQVQRTALELLLRCFELAVARNCRTVPEVVDHWQDRSPGDIAALLSGTVGDWIRAEAKVVTRASDLMKASEAWNAKVHGGHAHYDDPEQTDDDAELGRALWTLARWWLRTHAWVSGGVLPDWFAEGGPTRLGMGWFHRWVAARLDWPVTEMLREAFSGLVFAQHVRVALARFDGRVQRLRFNLGDDGIVPTPEVRDKFGSLPTRMNDRLPSFLQLLTDLDVLCQGQGDRYVSGPLAGTVERA
jgi:hypothetical protein